MPEFEKVKAVGFGPTPLRNGALSHSLRPLGQTVIFAKEPVKQAIVAKTVGWLHATSSPSHGHVALLSCMIALA